MRVIAVRLHRGLNKMDVLVEFSGGHLRIPISWMTRLPTDLPPADWYASVRREVELHRERTSASQASVRALNNFMAGRLK